MLVILVLCIAISHALHCRVDEDITGQTSVEYDIETEPRVEVNERYWTSNMQFFLYGELTEDSQIEAGFYTPQGELTLSVTVDCKIGAWKTNTKPGKRVKGDRVEKLRYEGTLTEPCRAGIFDLTYELQQIHRGKFMFNAQPMEGELVTKYKPGQNHRPEDSGHKRIKKLDTNLKYGTTFKASITGGGTFTRYAYGKCFAFPETLKKNCTEARNWIKVRSKLVGKVELNGAGSFEGLFGAGEYGAWESEYDVQCWELAPQYFFWVQRSVHGDEVNGAGLYCCCMTMTGDLGECASSADMGDACTKTCLSYIDHEIFDPITEAAREAAKHDDDE